MSARKRKIVLTVGPSTYCWLRALSRANKKAPLAVAGSSVEEMLEQAAFCLADCAGRRTGSWEADVARSLLTSSGYRTEADSRDSDRCHRYDEAENRAWRAKRGIK